MKFFTKREWLSVLLAIALSTFASADIFGQGKGQGKPGGHDACLKVPGLTDTQISQIAVLRNELMAETGVLRKQMQEATDPEVKNALREKMQARRDAQHAKMAELMDSEQREYFLAMTEGKGPAHAKGARKGQGNGQGKGMKDKACQGSGGGGCCKGGSQ